METDTIKLLRECNAGIKMGESAINKLLSHAKNDNLRNTLKIGKSTHAILGNETHSLLLKHRANTASPHPIADAMSNMKISATMMTKESDSSIADLVTDGCNMGIKSVSKYLNKYKNADEKSKSIAKRLIASEEFLENKMRDYL